MSQLKPQILALSEQYFEDTIAIRRRLHEYPELSFQEHETSKFIQEKLTEYGIPFESGIVETGIVALIKGQNPNSKCIALRADIDALPIHEMNNVSYASKNKGVMHACGHDFHAASLLGVARILNELKDKWEGSIKLIFQPGEEKLPGGASLMIEEGVLENPKVNKIIGQHVSPELDCGVIGMKEGMFMASADEIYIDVIGKGGHAAIPEGRINPLVIASKLITRLYDRFDEVNDTPSVLSIGVIQGGSAGNIIPEKVSMQGTFRAMDEDWRAKAHQIIEEICINTSKEMGGECNLEIRKGYPFLKNDVPFTEHCFRQASEFMASNSVIKIPKRMTAEDFSYYSHHVPSCFYRIGVGDKSGTRKHLHNPNFNVEEAALKHSIGLMSWLAISS